MRDILHTDRLVLRPLRLKDAHDLARLGGDEDVARMTGSIPYPFPTLSAEFWLMQVASKRERGLAYPYAVTQNGQDLIGVVDVFKRSADAALELGYWIGKPYWGQGLMYEACVAIINEAITTLGAMRLVAGVFVDNPASLRLLKKLGFRSDETYAKWYSMARLEKAEGVSLTLDMARFAMTQSVQSSTRDLPNKASTAMNATVRA